VVAPSQKLGIFDSGLGGVLIAKAIHESFPELDKIYLGDTLNLPYGARSQDAIYAAAKNCMDVLFQRGCTLIIIACNTVSASALRRLQREYLPEHYPDRRILGVVVPTLEEAIDKKPRKIAVIGTDYTIGTKIYTDELCKLDPSLQIKEVATPLLVPLIEYDGDRYLDIVLDDYLSALVEGGYDTLLLGCTHYIHLKDRIRERYGFDVISQDEIIPEKLNQYLNKHVYIHDNIKKSSNIYFYVTDFTERYARKASALFGKDITIQHIGDVHG